MNESGIFHSRLPTPHFQVRRQEAEGSEGERLRNQQQQILAEINSFVHSLAIEAMVEQLDQKAKQWNLDLEGLNSLRDNLRNLQQNAVLLYPLLLDDRLELVLVTADSPPIHCTTAVKREDLNRAIAQFRTALENHTINTKTSARQLYN